MMQPETMDGEEDAIFNRRKPGRRKGAPIPLESQVQRAIIRRLQFLGVMCVHIPNAGKRSRIAGRAMKQDGLRAGFPDLALYSREARHGLLEVKRPGYSPSDVSDAQRECHAEMRRRGIPVAIVTGHDEAVEVLRAWGWL